MITYPRPAPPHRATKLITAPVLEPFTLEEAKLHCRIDLDDDNANVLKWIKAARRKVEQDTGRALLTQTWDLFLDAFTPWGWGAYSYAANLPGYPRYGARDTIGIPYPPLASVTSINQTDTAGNETVWAASNYVVDTASEPGRVALSDSGSWPTGLRLFQPGRIRFVAGATSVDGIPGDLRQAVALLIAVFSENREPPLLRRGETAASLYEDMIATYTIFTAA
jgi:hypothetical protein